MWRADDGRLNDWLGRPDGGFISNEINLDSVVSNIWQIAGVGDFNGDGRSDILWRADDGRLNDWLGQADGGFASNDANLNSVVSNIWQIAGVGDFNGDGRSDILWRNDIGTLTNWLGTETGGFVDNWNVASQPVGIDLQVAGIGDFSGDGCSDILLRSSDNFIEVWEGSANGAILSPMEKLWNEALANVAAFFDEMTDQISNYDPGDGQQNSYYDDGSNTAPWPWVDDLASSLGWSEMQRQALGFHFWDYLTQNVDSEFLLSSFGPSELSASFGAGNFGSMTQLAGVGNTFAFNMNGILVRGVYHAGSVATGGINDQIVITGGGYWTFDPVTPGSNGLPDFDLPQQLGGAVASIFQVGLSTFGEHSAPFTGLPHMNYGDVRSLITSEKAALQGFTKLTSAQLDAVRIYAGGALITAAATSYNARNISFDMSYALTDFSQNRDTFDLLVHELYHVYQFTQNPVSTYFTLLGDLVVSPFSPQPNRYTYTAGDLLNFSSLRLEAQAQVAQDYYRSINSLPVMGAVNFAPSTTQLRVALGF